MNIRASQRVYRAPFLYLVQSPDDPRMVRIGHTNRPDYELQRMQHRFGVLRMLACVRAYQVLGQILCERFGYCAQGAQWFLPDRRVLLLAHMLADREPDALLSVGCVAELFARVFPDSPWLGVAEYRRSETYIRRTRRNTDSAC